MISDDLRDSQAKFLALLNGQWDILFGHVGLDTAEFRERLIDQEFELIDDLILTSEIWSAFARFLIEINRQVLMRYWLLDPMVHSRSWSHGAFQ